MSDLSGSRPTPLGIYDRPQKSRLSGIEITAFGLSVLWMVFCVVFFVLRGAADVDGLRFMLTALVVFLPVAMIWVAAMAAKSSRVMREESARLQSAIDAMRQAYVAQNSAQAQANSPLVAQKLDEIAAAQKKTESTLAMFTSSRDAPPARVETAPRPGSATPSGDQAGDQPSFELGTQAEDLAPPLATQDFIRALNFPETAEDKAGFASLRRALKDRRSAQLIQAAQDVLTLMSQDGIYMDDLRPDRARPEIWRRFAGGERGRVIASLGGVRNRSSLALTSGRMKQDPIFRDAAHHFLRVFDRTFAEFEPRGTDADISSLSDTRTARAFMLLGRVAGTFD